jgi:hypothetical protein
MELHIDGYGKAAIYRELERDQELQPHLPSEKTISRLIDDLGSRDISGPWTFLDDETGDPAPVLAVLAMLITDSEGRITSITRDEAALIARVHKVAPHWRPSVIWRFTRLYLMRRSMDRPTDYLDAYLAFASSGRPREEYQTALDNNWVYGPPMVIPEIFPLSTSSDLWQDPEMLGRYDDSSISLLTEDRTASEKLRGEIAELTDEIAVLTERIEARRRDSSTSAKPAPAPATAVSNPVSNDARSATSRGRPKRPQASDAQEGTDGNE